MFPFVVDRGVLEIHITQNVFNFNLSDEFQAIYRQVFLRDHILCIVESGVVVGSTGGLGFDVGGWNFDPYIKLIVRGSLQGKAGPGGDGADVISTAVGFGHTAPTAGQNGMPALRTRHPIDLDNQGEIWGGGGGGGGSHGTLSSGPYNAGGGGGSGAGAATSPPGEGGSAAGGGCAGSDGSRGTRTAGGTGGLGCQTGDPPAGRGGDGGDPGQPGEKGDDGNLDSMPGADGGQPGAAVDGESYINWLTFGDRRGPRIN